MTRIHPRLRGSTRTGWLSIARPFGLALAIAATTGAAIALSPLGPFAGSACAGAGPSHAALVVEHGDGVTIERCVAFSGASIKGDQLLELSGIEYSVEPFGGFGQAVCQIDAEPAHFSTCLPPSPDPYWAMFVARGRGPWTTSNLGISSQTFANGDAEGFRYDPQTGTAAPPPAPRPCPSPTPVPTATSKPPSAATPRPTMTSKPPSAATPRPTVGATAKPTPDRSPSPSLATGPTSALPSPSPVALAVAAAAAPAAIVTPPPTEPTDASSTGDLATAGATIALLALLVVGLAAAHSRRRRAAR